MRRLFFYSFLPVYLLLLPVDLFSQTNHLLDGYQDWESQENPYKKKYESLLVILDQKLILLEDKLILTKKSLGKAQEALKQAQGLLNEQESYWTAQSILWNKARQNYEARLQSLMSFEKNQENLERMALEAAKKADELSMSMPFIIISSIASGILIDELFRVLRN